MKGLDFRTNKPQPSRTLGGDFTVTHVGPCAVCGCRVYDDGDQNDPRGPVGLRVNAPLVAREFGMVGADVVVCYGCRQEAPRYRRALEIAKKGWANGA